MDLYPDVCNQVCEEKSLVSNNNPGPLDQLRLSKRNLEERLSKVDAAIVALENNLEISNILTLVQKGMRA